MGTKSVNESGGSERSGSILLPVGGWVDAVLRIEKSVLLRPSEGLVVSETVG